MILFILIDKKQTATFQEDWHVTGVPKTAKDKQLAAAFSGKLHVVNYDTPIRRIVPDPNALGAMAATIHSGYDWAYGTTAIPSSKIFLPAVVPPTLSIKGWLSHSDHMRLILNSVWNYLPCGITENIYSDPMPEQDTYVIAEMPLDNLYMKLVNGAAILETITDSAGGIFKVYQSDCEISGVGEGSELSLMMPTDPLAGTSDWFFKGTTAAALTDLYNLLKSGETIAYRDNIFSLDIPKFGTENNFEEYGLQSNFVTIKPSYNHYLCAYEDNISDVDERILYNVYTLLSQIRIENLSKPSTYAISIFNPHPVPPAGSYKKYLSFNNPKIIEPTSKTSMANLSNLLNNFGLFHEQGPSSVGLEVIPEDIKEPKKKKFTYIGFSVDSMELLKEANENKNKFPMYIELDILTQNTGRLFDLLKKSTTFNRLMKYVMIRQRAHSERFHHEGLGVSFGKDFKATPASLFIDEPTYAKTTEGEIYDIPNKAIDFVEGAAAKGRSEPLMWIDIKDFLIDGEHAKQPGPGGANALDNIWTREHVNLYGEKTKDTSLKAPGFLDTIKKAMLKIKLTQFIDEHTRTIKDIYEGKPAHSEVLFYEVVKYKVTKSFFESNDTTDAQFIQSIFIPNEAENIITKYIDTQVKPNTHYFYQVYAHTAVLGNDYSLKDFYRWTPQIAPGKISILDIFGKEEDISAAGAPGQLGSFWRLVHENSPRLDLIRVPYYNTVATTANVIQTEACKGEQTAPDYVYSLLEDSIIKDYPPVFPNVNIVPFAGVNDKILINLNFSTGEYELNPIAIDDSEEEAIEELLKSQNKITAKSYGNYLSKLLFKTDEHFGTFQALRIDKMPTSYKDFAPTSNTSRPLDAERSLTDKILPNKDYFYTFRTVDVHGHFSNPTPIYQVRIVDEKGVAPYMVVKSFFIDEVQGPKKKKDICLMKYIQIEPAFSQTVLDVESIRAKNSAINVDTAAISDSLPPLKEKVFGKNFKFRFTSKRTGRKFDLKVAVKGVALKDKSSQTSGGTEICGGISVDEKGIPLDLIP